MREECATPVPNDCEHGINLDDVCKDCHIKELEEECGDYEDTLTAKQEELARMEDELAELGEQLGKKDLVNEILRANIKLLRERVAELEGK
jgi:chromosome segregation ATPase